MSLKSWVLAARPKTLVASLVPILCSTFLVSAVQHTPLSSLTWSVTVLAVLSALCIQIGTNLVNDAIDFQKGADTVERLGPTRVSQSGLISPKKVMNAGFFFFALAILFGFPLVLKGGLPILCVGIVSVIFGYLYTGGPYPMAYKGLGEVFVFLCFGLTAVCGTYFLYTHRIDNPSVVLGAQIGALATVIIAVNNYRDSNTDQKANKLTLAVRFGKTFARYEILFLYLLAYCLNFYWLSEYGFSMFVIATLSLPVALKVIFGIFKNEPSKELNKYLGLSALTELLFGVGISLGFLFFA